MPTPSIWVLEDSGLVAEGVSVLLGLMGCTVRVFRGGQAVLDALEVEPPPAVLICDLIMRPPDGNDVLEALGRRDGLKPQVVLLTGDTDNLRPGLESQYVAILNKPFSIEQLQEALRLAGVECPKWLMPPRGK